MKGLGFRRVKIFRLAVTQHPSAKGQNMALPVGDREHDPVAEIVGDAPVVPPLQYPCGNQLILADPIAGQPGRDAAIARWRVAQTEAADGGVIDPPPVQVGQRLPAIRHPKLAFVICRGQFQRFPQALGHPAAFLRFGAVRWHIHACHAGNRLHGFPETLARGIHQERKDIAVLA